MVILDLDEEQRILDFAKKAARNFRDTKNVTYTSSEIAEGCLFAVKWGCADTSVLVFKLDENFEPRVFEDLIQDV